MDDPLFIILIIAVGMIGVMVFEALMLGEPP